MRPALPLWIALSLILSGCPSIATDDDVSGGDGTQDVDGDGYSSPDDCDDGDPAINPGADELCNETDDDCDGVVDNDPVDGNTYYADADGDGYYGAPVLACSLPEGAGFASNDCNDEDPLIHPGADEGCDGVDSDCDGAPASDEVDTDLDGFLACAECDDTDPLVSPAAAEQCDGIDNDCDGELDEQGSFALDADGDGFGDAAQVPVVASCDAPPDGLVSADRSHKARYRT